MKRVLEYAFGWSALNKAINAVQGKIPITARNFTPFVFFLELVSLYPAKSRSHSISPKLRLASNISFKRDRPEILFVRFTLKPFVFLSILVFGLPSANSLASSSMMKTYIDFIC